SFPFKLANGRVSRNEVLFPRYFRLRDRPFACCYLNLHLAIVPRVRPLCTTGEIKAIALTSRHEHYSDVWSNSIERSRNWTSLLVGVSLKNSIPIRRACPHSKA